MAGSSVSAWASVPVSVDSADSVEGPSRPPADDEASALAPHDAHAFGLGVSAPRSTPHDAHAFGLGVPAPRSTPHDAHAFGLGVPAPRSTPHNAHAFRLGVPAPRSTEVAPHDAHAFGLGVPAPPSTEVAPHDAHAFALGVLAPPPAAPHDAHAFGLLSSPGARSPRLFPFTVSASCRVVEISVNRSQPPSVCGVTMPTSDRRCVQWMALLVNARRSSGSSASAVPMAASCLTVRPVMPRRSAAKSRRLLNPSRRQCSRLTSSATICAWTRRQCTSRAAISHASASAFSASARGPTGVLVRPVRSRGGRVPGSRSALHPHRSAGIEAPTTGMRSGCERPARNVAAASSMKRKYYETAGKCKCSEGEFPRFL